MTLAKAITKTLDIDVEDVRIDLAATIKSYDLTDTKFIFDIHSSDGLTIDLTGSTAMYIVEYVHDSQTYAIQGDITVVNSTKISFNLPEDLKGYSGTVLIGIYVKLTDGTKIDIKDIAVRIEPSIMDKDIDFTAKTYFKDFESIKAEVVLAGETAKTQIKAVLPSVQAEISEIKTEIENLPDIPDLFVAYADDINGSGFSKTGTTKLYKGYGVKNSTNPSDYRWERNVDGLQVGGRNYLIGTNKEYKEFSLEQYYTVLFTRNLADLNLKVGEYITASCGLKVPPTAIKGGVIRIQLYNSPSDRLIFNGETCNIGEEKRLRVTVKVDERFLRYSEIHFAILSSNTNVTDYEHHIQSKHEKLEIGNMMTDWIPAPEEMLLNSNPINSILTTLSSENPSTTLGGTWTQLGTETKFGNTIYYWKRTN